MDNLIDVPSDAYFMNEALRLAAKAFEKEEVPVGAVVVREGKIIGRALQSSGVAQGRDGACGDARDYAGGSGRGGLAVERLRSLRDEGTVRHVRRRVGARPDAAGDLWLSGSTRRGRGRRVEPVANARSQSPVRDYGGCSRRTNAPSLLQSFFQARRRDEQVRGRLSRRECADLRRSRRDARACAI